MVPDFKLKQNPSKDNLIKYFRNENDSKIKTIMPLSDEKDKFQRINVAIMNPAGISEVKGKIMENIVNANRIDILIVSETNSHGKEKPKIGGMTPFNRNRSTSGVARGGVCIFVNNNVAKDTVLLDVGTAEDNDEFISIKINSTSPPLVVAALYGAQESGPRKGVRQRWRRIFSILEEYKRDGSSVIMGGDWNTCLGTELGLVNNDSFISYGGKEVLREIEDGDWSLINGMTNECHKSHLDRTSLVERCLDYCIINIPNLVDFVTTDPDREMTPYTHITKKKKVVGRKFSDHRTLAFSLKMSKVQKKKEKLPVRFIKTDESIERFKARTDNLADELIGELLREDCDLDLLVKRIDREMNRIKYSVHEPKRPSKKRKQAIDDDTVFWETLKSLDKEMDNIKHMKANNKVFNVRMEKMMEERRQQMSVVLNKSGVLVEEKDDILDVLLKYNEDLLSRNIHLPEFEEIAKLKREVQDVLMKANIRNFETITEEEWEEIVDKVTVKGKKMFEDFVQSGEQWKHFMFLLTKKIYEEETIPESFLVTTLSALYKKGDPRQPSNYRYIHVRRAESRLLEMAIYNKLSKTYNDTTSSTQLGGMPESSTTEHLTTLMTVINQREKEGGGIVVTFQDVQKCFDNIHLSDMCWYLVKGGADPKATKMQSLLTGTNIIKVQGSEKTFKIENGVGQGGVNAARLTSGGTSECFHRNLKCHPKPMIFNNVDVTLNEFVDDAMFMDEDSEGAKMSGRIITNTLGELALKAHPEKTVQVVVGSEQYIREMKKELLENLTEVQGFVVKQVEAEKYLGMKISSGGVRKIVADNIQEKKKKVIIPVNDIRRMSRTRKMKRIGTIRAVKLLIQAQIVPIMTYSSESWLMMTPKDYKEMEDIYKHTICNTMSLPMSSNHESLLHEIANVHMEAWLDATKLKFFNRLLNEKRRGNCYKIMREEIIRGTRGGFIQDLEQLCIKYKLPNVSLHFIRPQDIASACREWSMRRQFVASIMVKTLPMLFRTRKFEREHWDSDKFTNMMARAQACFNTGNLVMKSQSPHMMRLKDQGDRSCLFPACGGNDTYEHVRFECEFYSSKYIDTKECVLDNSKYLLKLDEERRIKFNTPLIVPLPIL